MKDAGIKECERLSGLVEIARSCGWWWPYTGVAILTDRPCHLSRDDQGRLHDPLDAAIKYRDGWGVYAWHGVRVPAHVITDPGSITVAQIQSEPNAEVRRVMLERYGVDKYAKDAGLHVVDRSDFGTLYREAGGNDPITVVQVTNSTPEPDGTYKDYWLNVHPDLCPLPDGDDSELGEPQSLTALNAVASTFGLTGAEYLLTAQS
jgi:hypothetical protein